MEHILKHLAKAEHLFVLIAIVFGLVFIKITPPLWGIDESSHFIRVYQLAHGSLVPDKTKNNYGGKVPNNLIDLANYVQSDLVDDKGGGIASRKDVDSTNAYKQLTDKQFSKGEHSYIWSAAYSPVAYIGSIVGVFLAGLFNSSIAQTIFLARLGSLLLYIAIVWLAIRVLRASKLKWLIFAVALLPTCIFQASVVTADNMAIGLSILFVSLLTRVMQKDEGAKNKGVLYGLIAAATLLPLIKINYIFISLALVLIPDRLFRTRKIAIATKLGSISLLVILGLIWSLIAKVTSASSISQRPDGIKVVPADQIAALIHNPLHFAAVCIRSIVVNADSYLQSMTSLMGWNYVTIPLVFIVALCLGVVLAAVYAKNELAVIRKKLILLNILVLGGVISIFGALYITFTPAGSRIIDSIQGRYFIPFLIPIGMLLAAFAPFEVKIKDKVTPYIFGTISATCLTISVIYYYLGVY